MSASERQPGPAAMSATSGRPPAAALPSGDTRLAGRFGFLGAFGAYPTFRQLWLGTMAGSVGQWMQQVAIGWLALVITNSPSFVGIVTFVAGIPFILVGPPAGNLIDRIDRRRLLLTCQSLSAVLAIVVAVDIFTGTVQPWHLLIVAFLNGCLLSLMAPTQQSLVPTLVERPDLTSAIALMSAGQNLTRVAGPSVAGLLIARWDIGIAFVAQAVMLVVAFLLIFRIVLPERPHVDRAGAGIFDGARIIWGRPEIRTLFLMVAIFMFFVAPYLSFINVFARDILQIGATGLGVLMAASGSGAVVGALFVAARGRTTGVGPALIILTVIYGFMIAGVAVSPTAWLTAGLMFASGWIGSTVFSLNTALVQHRISDEVRGRVMSTYFLTWGLMPLGALPMGLVADQFGARVAVGASALLSSLLVAILGLTSPQIRKV